MPAFFARWVSFFSLCVLLSIKSFAVPFYGHRMVVAGPSPTIDDISREISTKGGNVVDVAVAIGFGLAVTSPYYGALGGGGFALVKSGPRPVAALDFREVAPRSSHAKMYVETTPKASVDGGLAIGVPGVTAGLWELHRKHGKLAWKSVLAPAIRMARDGFRVSGEWAQLTEKNESRFSPGGLSAFFKKDGSSYKPGEILRQPALANALQIIAAQGAKGFYEGPIAKDLASTIQSAGGVITKEDLRDYKTRWLEPLKSQFQGHTLYLMPPPSSGGVVIHGALRIAELTNLPAHRPLSIDELHGLAEALKIAFRGRTLLGDPDFTKNPLSELMSDSTLRSWAQQVKADRTLKIEPMKESEQTTHFSVMDAHGNAVALTVTLNGDYGSGIVSSKYGIALNNEMDDFTTRPGEPNMFGLIQGRANEVAPGKRPLSSMSPTLVEKDGKIVMSLGSPGGPRIISAVTQVLYRTLVNGFDMDQAIQAPRLHHQFQPDKLFVDANRFSPEVLALLEKRGHKIEESRVAKVYGVRRTAKGLLEAAFDSRGEGGAGGH
ncbi:MAG: gamma-glutamyltransferase [Bdellovibrionaceae bacterium]|nr:gamma-glutamyltransferase [Pseudobdellovibrionaceae bacterium]